MDKLNTLLQGQESLLEVQGRQEDRLQQIQQQIQQMGQMLASVLQMLQMHGARTLSVQPAAPSSTHVDFLFVVCSPNVSPLPEASIEAQDNAACVERAGLSALVHSNGDLTELNTIILHRQPRVIVFAGHADASHPSLKRTLGLTNASGKLIIMEPDTIARIFSQPSERLELVSLNGCCSSELCETITRRYLLPACGWSSLTADAAAKAHSLGLVDALVQHIQASGWAAHQRRPAQRLPECRALSAGSSRQRRHKRVGARRPLWLRRWQDGGWQVGSGSAVAPVPPALPHTCHW